MSNIATQKNIGATIKALYAAIATAVAGGAGDAAEVTSVIIDRNAHKMPLSALFAFGFSAVLAAAATLKIAYTIEHGDAADMSDAANFSVGAAAVVATGAAGGSTETGVLEVPLALDGAKQYLRIKFTPDLSAANTDTAKVAALVIVGGESVTPAV